MSEGRTRDENQLIAERRAKLARLRERGNAFPNDFRRDALAGRIAHGVRREEPPSGSKTDPTPVQRRRTHAARSASWARRASRRSRIAAAQIQLFLQQDALGDAYEDFKGWDIGDIVGAEGTLFRTKTGELSVRVDEAAPADEVAAAAARQVAWPCRYRDCAIASAMSI